MPVYASAGRNRPLIHWNIRPCSDLDLYPITFKTSSVHLYRGVEYLCKISSKSFKPFRRQGFRSFSHLTLIVATLNLNPRTSKSNHFIYGLNYAIKQIVRWNSVHWLLRYRTNKLFGTHAAHPRWTHWQPKTEWLRLRRTCRWRAEA